MKIKKIFVILLILFMGSSFASATDPSFKEVAIDGSAITTCEKYGRRLDVYSSAFAKASTMLYYETSYNELKNNGDAMEAALSHMKSISSEYKTSVKVAFNNLHASALQTQYNNSFGNQEETSLKSFTDLNNYFLSSSDSSLFTEDMDKISKNKYLIEYVNYFNAALNTTYEIYRNECKNPDDFYKNEDVQSSVKASLNNSVSNFCDYLKFSPGIARFIKMALDIVTYSAMLLAIILGIIDFIKAIGANDDAGLSKAFNTFMKRVIAVILIFCANIMVVFILNLVPINGLDADHAICDELGIANGGIFGD